MLAAITTVAEQSHVGAELNVAVGTSATEAALPIPRYAVADVDMRIDGVLDESIWADVPAYDNMTVTTPDEGREGRYKTQTHLFYTEEGLYVGAWNEQPPDTLLSRLSGRDSFDTVDAYQILIDSSGNGLYGYWFMAKLGGSIADGVLLPERNFQNNWDGPWHSATKKLDNGWSVEMFLPWAMMNMPRSSEEGNRQIGILVVRDLGVINERWSWPALPGTQPKFISAFQPFVLPGVEPQQEVSLFPYASFNRDMERGSDESDIGLDVFWRPSPAFFLSGAVNPDFGQVEADNVVVNLTAFETFFPEKRLFFLENQDVFDTRGDISGPPRTLLHTRRIGSSVGSRRGGPDLDGSSFDGFDTSQPVDLLVAAKAVAQRGKHRGAVLFAAEDDTPLALSDGDGTVEASGRDFAVLRWLHDDTSAGGRRTIGWLGTITEHPERRAITQAVDVHWDSADGAWNIDGELMHSSIESDDGFGIGATAKYSPRRGDRHYLNVFGYDKQIDLNDLGFLSRNDNAGFFYEFWRRRQNYESIRDTNGWVDVLGAANGDGKLVNAFIVAYQGLTFNNNYNIFGNVGYRPAFWDDRNSRGAGAFKLDERYTVNLGFNSPSEKKLSLGWNIGLWQEHFEGHQISTNLFLNYSPIDRLNVNLGLGYNKRENWLIWQGGSDFSGFESEQWGPNLSVQSFFTARQQLRIQLQWVAIQAHEASRYLVEPNRPLLPQGAPPITERSSFAISDLVIQVRYRWQIAPMSDLFIVYNRGGALPGASTDSSFADLFDDTLSAPEREGFVVKLRYRFGL